MEDQGDDIYVGMKDYTENGMEARKFFLLCELTLTLSAAQH